MSESWESNPSITVQEPRLEEKGSLLKVAYFEGGFLIIDDASSTSSLSQVSDEDLFDSHFQRWQEETLPLSSISEISEHPSYQEIIMMGKRALPFLIQRLRDNREDPDFLFVALSKITGKNPVAEKDYGYMSKMADAWIKWWESGYGE